MFVNERATTTAGGEAVIWDYHDVAVDFCDPDIRAIQQGVRYEGEEKEKIRICYILYHIAQPQMIVCEFAEVVGYWKMGISMRHGKKITIDQAAEYIMHTYIPEPATVNIKVKVKQEIKDFINQLNNILE